MNVVILPADNIHIGERQRSDVPEAHIKELAREIQDHGLIHAITLDSNFELRAGFCRLNAIKSLDRPYFYASQEIPVGHVPCVIVHHQDEAELFRLELMENLRRKNLSPLDEAKAVAQLHRLLSKEHGPEWTQRDSGQELDKLRGEARDPKTSRDEVGESLLLDSFASNSEVAKAKTKREAVKIAKKLAEQELTAALGGIEVYRESFDMEVIHGDATVEIRRLELGRFAGIISDPPYGIDADGFGEQTLAGGHQYGDSSEVGLAISRNIFESGARICSDDAHLYMFCDIRKFAELSSLASSFGWQVFATPLIWHKPTAGHAPWPGYFSRRYECILFAQRGGRKLAKSRSDVFEFAGVKEKIHAAEKPVELLRELISLSFFPGERILDPTCGSGSIFRAGHAAKVKVTGIELNPQYYQICKQVIGELE